MDDGRQRDSAPGDAQGRRERTHAWFPTVGEPAGSAKDDRSAEDDGTHARIICGEFWGKRGPVEGVAADPRYVDISVPPGKSRRIQVEIARNAFAYVFAGAGTFRDASDPQAVLTESGTDPNAAPVYDAKNHSLVLFDRGDEIVVQAGPEGIRFLLVSGKPLEEPVAWYGPIVMNTQAELRQAMSELQSGKFIKHK
jgi:quercetin 2,3-dioxygenase